MSSLLVANTTTAAATGYTGSISTVEAIGGFNVFDLVHTGIAWVLIAAAFLSVVFILYGGLSFILSGGQEEKVRQAVSTIRYAIIGLVVTIMAITVVAFVGRVFGVDLVFIQFQKILDTVSEIISKFSATN